MRRVGSVVLAIAFLTAPLSLGAAQDQKSPDLQQQKHPENNPPPEANQPNTTAGPTSTDQTDTETKSKSGKRNKKKHNARQARGRPEPAPK